MSCWRPHRAFAPLRFCMRHLVFPMRQDQIEEGKLSHHGSGLGTITPEMVQARAVEIAVINGRSADSVLKSDWDEAWRELTGRENHREPSGDWTIETSQWDPAPGTPGHKTHTKPTHDEQTDSERICEQGVSEAEHDLMVEHTREQIRQSEEL